MSESWMGRFSSELGGAGVAGRGEDGFAARGLGEFPGEGVLASAAADDQDAHGVRVSDGVRFTVRPS